MVLLLTAGGGASAAALAASSSPQGSTPTFLTAATTSTAPTQSTPEGTSGSPYLLPCTRADEPTNFAVFTLGSSFAGIPYWDDNRLCAEPAEYAQLNGRPIRSNDVTVVYGKCDFQADDRGSCDPPLEVQSWPACERNASLYEKGNGLKLDSITIQGAPAAVFEDGQRIEVYTGSSTVVVFAHDPTTALAAAKSIVAIPADQPPSVPPIDGVGQPGSLPPPVEGAMDGSLTCHS